jgi:hypothetical protein
MMSNNPHTQFENGLKGLRKLSLTPREKGEIFHKLYNYTLARPAPADSTLYAAFLKTVKAYLPIK